MHILDREYTVRIEPRTQADTLERYYNGTTSFRLSSQDWSTGEDDKVCANFRDQDIVVSFDSLVAIVKPNGYDKGGNPVMLLAKSWPENLNLTPTADYRSPYSGQVNDFIFNLESMRYLHFLPP
jgi:hypothetical protein